MSSPYDLAKILKSLPWPRLAAPLDVSSRVLTRVDERVKRTPDLGAGFQARAHFFDIASAMALDGELIHLEDLVLHDAGTDRRAPTHELTRAARLLDLRRRLERQSPDRVLSLSGIFALTGQSSPAGDTDTQERPERGGALSGRSGGTPATGSEEEKLFAELDRILKRTEHLAQGRVLSKGSETALTGRPSPGPDRNLGTESRLEHWIEVLRTARAEDLPPVLTAVLLLDAWQVLKPMDSWPELGRFLAEIFLKSETTPNHLPMLCVGFRKSPFRWRRQAAPAERLTGLLSGIERAASESMEQLDRLQLAQERLARSCRGSRSHSKLPGLTSLFLTRPLVTIPMARQELGVTAAAIDRMLEQLGPALPRELTGRSRYRAWGIL